MFCPYLPGLTIFFQTQKPVAYLLKNLMTFCDKRTYNDPQSIIDINVLDTDNLLDFDDMT